ncbi:MAG: excinuclease ABC subunit UvrC [Bacteroidales bacterium]
MSIQNLKQQTSLLPELPGVYIFNDRNSKILYIGKAKSLRKRVNSYFLSNENKSKKLKVLINQINSIDHIVVENESDALLLENTLIKKHQPKYNVLLKDDKTFPWICIKSERFPRVFITRNVIDDGSEYFGPYTSSHTVRSLLELIKQLYKLRSCKYVLSKSNIEKGKLKICLEYHIGNCLGPCENLQSEEDYNKALVQIREILKGNYHQVIAYLKKGMHNFSNKLQFEEANNLKLKIESLEKFKNKSIIVNPKLKNLDVFSYDEDEKSAFVNYIKIVNGSLVHSHTVEVVKKLDEDKNELFLFVITNLRERYHSNVNELVVPFYPGIEIQNSKFTIPNRGDKKKLLEMSFRNLNIYKQEKLRKSQQIVNYIEKKSIINRLQNDLKLKEVPVHIECFDNSNIQGKFPVASCVVFINGKPKKSEYRHFNIKTVEGADDFASMQEIIFRRYKRVIEEEKDLPQLIIIDGGKGQLNSALLSLEKLGVRDKVSVIGIAKKLEKIYFPNDPVPLFINKNSSSLKLIQKIRNEAHRFGITFHRKKHETALLQTGVEKIPGIGPSTISKLISHFGSYSNLVKADLLQIEKILDKRKARIIFDYFISE